MFFIMFGSLQISLVSMSSSVSLVASSNFYFVSVRSFRSSSSRYAIFHETTQILDFALYLFSSVVALRSADADALNTETVNEYTREFIWTIVGLDCER